jgi:hypothetical protein
VKKRLSGSSRSIEIVVQRACACSISQRNHAFGYDPLHYIQYYLFCLLSMSLSHCRVRVAHVWYLEQSLSRAHFCAFVLFFAYFSSILQPSLAYILSGPLNSPTAGGAVITVIGPILQPISIAVGLTSCASIVIISFDSVACKVAAGTGASVDVKAYSQTVSSHFSYDAPRVSRCSFVSAAGGLVQLSGSNFGTSQPKDDGTLSITVSGTPVSHRWLNDSSIMMMAPAGAGRTMDFSVSSPI